MIFWRQINGQEQQFSILTFNIVWLEQNLRVNASKIFIKQISLALAFLTIIFVTQNVCLYSKNKIYFFIISILEVKLTKEIVREVILF